MSSDTSIGDSAEVEMALLPWPAAQDEQDGRTAACADPDTPRWLQLSPSDTANLTGAAAHLLEPPFYMSLKIRVYMVQFAYTRCISFDVNHHI